MLGNQASREALIDMQLSILYDGSTDDIIRSRRLLRGARGHDQPDRHCQQRSGRSLEIHTHDDVCCRKTPQKTHLE